MEQHRIPTLPSSAYYIPNFVTASEEARILTHIHSLPTHKWITLSHRRLLSIPSPLSGTAKDTLLDSPLPESLSKPIIQRFSDLQIFAASPHQQPNHVLVNEYLPGQGIMPHTDGPAYFPTTATVSLGGHTVLDIYEKGGSTDEGNGNDGDTKAENGTGSRRPRWRILQEPRSLLVTMDELYTETLHGIAEKEVDEDLGPEGIANWNLLGDKTMYEAGSRKREVRVSLTYRDVRKVAKVGGAMKFLGKR